ncbi:hypothetical protein SNARM312S_07352 [Streptomyces narbonensis]
MTEPQKRPLPVRVRRHPDAIPMDDLFRSDSARPTGTLLRPDHRPEAAELTEPAAWVQPAESAELPEPGLRADGITSVRRPGHARQSSLSRSPEPPLSPLSPQSPQSVPPVAVSRRPPPSDPTPTSSSAPRAGRPRLARRARRPHRAGRGRGDAVGRSRPLTGARLLALAVGRARRLRRRHRRRLEPDARTHGLRLGAVALRPLPRHRAAHRPRLGQPVRPAPPDRRQAAALAQRTDLRRRLRGFGAARGGPGGLDGTGHRPGALRRRRPSRLSAGSKVEAAAARVLSQLPADAFRGDVPTLRNAEAVGDALTRMLAAECRPVGIAVFSAQPTRIEYDPRWPPRCSGGRSRRWTPSTGTPS